MTDHRMQWNDATLIDQIVEGAKTATVRPLESSEGLDEYNTAIHCGATYTVYDRDRVSRCHVRITAIQLVTWGTIPEALWRRDPAASGMVSLQAFRTDHWDYFNQPADDFEFLALYFDHMIN